MVLTILLALALPSEGMLQEVPDDCGHGDVMVEGSPSEIELACEALKDVIGFFDAIGFPLDPVVTIAFRNAVAIELGGVEASRPPIRLPVTGLFDPVAHTIEVTSPSSAPSDSRFWSMPWSPDVAATILVHELAHMAIFQILDDRWPLISRAWLEYLAYAVQFELMPSALRERILTAYPDARPFEDPAHVNRILLFIDADLFAVRAHLHATSEGGRDHIRRLLSDPIALPVDHLLSRP